METNSPSVSESSACTTQAAVTLHFLGGQTITIRNISEILYPPHQYHARRYIVDIVKLKAAALEEYKRVKVDQANNGENSNLDDAAGAVAVNDLDLSRSQSDSVPKSDNESINDLKWWNLSLINGETAEEVCDDNRELDLDLLFDDSIFHVLLRRTGNSDKDIKELTLIFEPDLRDGFQEPLPETYANEMNVFFSPSENDIFPWDGISPPPRNSIVNRLFSFLDKHPMVPIRLEVNGLSGDEEALLEQFILKVVASLFRKWTKYRVTEFDLMELGEDEMASICDVLAGNEATRNVVEVADFQLHHDYFGEHVRIQTRLTGFLRSHKETLVKLSLQISNMKEQINATLSYFLTGNSTVRCCYIDVFNYAEQLDFHANHSLRNLTTCTDTLTAIGSCINLTDLRFYTHYCLHPLEVEALVTSVSNLPNLKEADILNRLNFMLPIWRIHIEAMDNIFAHLSSSKLLRRLHFHLSLFNERSFQYLCEAAAKDRRIKQLKIGTVRLYDARNRQRIHWNSLCEVLSNSSSIDEVQIQGIQNISDWRHLGKLVRNKFTIRNFSIPGATCRENDLVAFCEELLLGLDMNFIARISQVPNHHLGIATSKLQTLKLNSVKMGDVGMCKVSTFLKFGAPRYPLLNTVGLSYIPTINRETALSFVAVLEAGHCCCKLKCLELSKSLVLDDIVVDKIVSALRKNTAMDSISLRDSRKDHALWKVDQLRKFNSLLNEAPNNMTLTCLDLGDMGDDDDDIELFDLDNREEAEGIHLEIEEALVRNQDRVE